MNSQKKDEITVWEEIKGQAIKNKHHVAKIIISVILIPVVSILLDRFVMGDSVPLWVSMAISTWATYVLITIYDRVLTRDSQRAKSQIIKNTLDILVIKEDVKKLQEEVYKEDIEKIRQRNMHIAMMRKGTVYPREVKNATKAKDNTSE